MHCKRGYSTNVSVTHPAFSGGVLHKRAVKASAWNGLLTDSIAAIALVSCGVFRSHKSSGLRGRPDSIFFLRNSGKFRNVFLDRS